jgi:hypothetical protein
MRANLFWLVDEQRVKIIPAHSHHSRARGGLLLRGPDIPARFNPKFMGNWTDLDAVLGGLNKALPRQAVRSALPISTAAARRPA